MGSVELIVPFLLGTVLLLWQSGGPSISAFTYIVYLALYLGFMPARGVIVPVVYTLLFPALPILPYMVLAASIRLTLNAGFTPVFSNGLITVFGLWTIWSEYLVISGCAAIVYLVMVLIKRWRASQRMT